MTTPDSELDLIRRLRRVTFGASGELVSSVRREGFESWLERQLSPDGDEGSIVAGLLAEMPDLGRLPADVVEQAVADKTLGSWVTMLALGRAAMGRAIWSPAQVLERMIDFWSNHFNVTSPSDPVWSTRAHMDTFAIRPNALGNFRQLLADVIHHPAMLIYLNNSASTRRQPNENLGRELLELHTVGVEAGYSEADVLDSARILTGMGVQDGDGFAYRPSEHWIGPVKVLGFEHVNSSPDGQEVVRAYLDYLSRHPSTAHRLATRLVTHFVADSPPPGLVGKLAGVFSATDGDIRSVLRTLFAAPELVGGHMKIRRPFEVMIAACRSLGILPGSSVYDGLGWLGNVLESQGNRPLAWAQPDGYPEESVAWQSASTTLLRINALTALVCGELTEFKVPKPQMFFPVPLSRTHGELVAGVHERLHLLPISVDEVDDICAYLGVKPSTPVTRLSPVVGSKACVLVAAALNCRALLLT